MTHTRSTTSTHTDRWLARALWVVIALAPIGGAWFVWREATRGSARNWSPAEVDAAQRQGDEIAAALLAYRDAHGAFPVSLQDMVPAFLPKVAKPAAGVRRWEYQVDHAGNAWLSLCANRDCYPSISWNSPRNPLGDWRHDS